MKSVVLNCQNLTTCRLCASAGVTGSVRLHTSMAALVPIALQAMEEDVGTTCVIKVSKDIFFIQRRSTETCYQPQLSVYPTLDSQRSETPDMNEVEKPQVPVQPRTTARPAPKPSAPKKPASKPSTPKLTTPRTPSSKTPSNTYLGSYRSYLKSPQTLRLSHISTSIFFYVFCSPAHQVRDSTAR